MGWEIHSGRLVWAQINIRANEMTKTDRIYAQITNILASGDEYTVQELTNLVHWELVGNW